MNLPNFNDLFDHAPVPNWNTWARVWPQVHIIFLIARQENAMYFLTKFSGFPVWNGAQVSFQWSICSILKKMEHNRAWSTQPWSSPSPELRFITNWSQIVHTKNTCGGIQEALVFLCVWTTERSQRNWTKISGERSKTMQTRELE